MLTNVSNNELAIENDVCISVDNLTHQYHTRTGSVTALQNVCFNVNRGEFFVILGPSGCGKSTLMKALCGLLTPTHGTVTVNGVKVTEPMERVGIVFQQPILLKWLSILDNVLLPATALGYSKGEYIETAKDLLSLVGLSGFESKYPNELSGGMQQRVSIARSLLLDPDFLLMDEPFGALDAITRDVMNEELLKVWEKKKQTIVFITHSISEAVFMADHIMMLSSRPGRVFESQPVLLPRPRDNQTRADALYCSQVTDLYNVLAKIQGEKAG